MKVHTIAEAKAKFSEAKALVKSEGAHIFAPKAAFELSKLITNAIGILVLAIVFILAPTIGNAIQTAMPIESADANWTKISGASLWGTLAPMIQVVAIVGIAGLVITSIMDFRREAQ